MNKLVSRAVLIIEIILTLLFSAIIIDTCLVYYDSGINPSFSIITTTLSMAIAIIFPLAAHIVIRLKHRSNTPEGEILPFLFLSITLECVSFLPTYYIETGNLLLDPILINVLIRFAFITNALIFMFVALLLMGVNNNNYLSYFILSVISALILSIMAPNSSAIQMAGSNFGSDYDTNTNAILNSGEWAAIDFATYKANQYQDWQDGIYNGASCYAEIGRFILQVVPNITVE